MSVGFKEKFRFSAENRFAIGVEEEIWTVHPKSGVLMPVVPKLFRKEGKKFPNLKPELPAQQIEAVTPICRSIVEVSRALSFNEECLMQLSTQYGFHLSREPVPTKPFSVTVYPTKRYREIQERFGDRLRGAYVAGLHIHIGVGSPDEAVRALNLLRQYLPAFLALSARSDRTLYGRKYASFRFIKYRQMAGNVVPPFLSDWQEFEAEARSGGFFEDPRMCWWAVRISPHGTVELRVCDVQAERSMTLALVAITRMLVRAAVEGVRKGAPTSANIIEDLLFVAAQGACETTTLVRLADTLTTRFGAKEESRYIRRLLY